MTLRHPPDSVQHAGQCGNLSGQPISMRQAAGGRRCSRQVAHSGRLNVCDKVKSSRPIFLKYKTEIGFGIQAKQGISITTGIRSSRRCLVPYAETCRRTFCHIASNMALCGRTISSTLCSGNSIKRMGQAAFFSFFSSQSRTRKNRSG